MKTSVAVLAAAAGLALAKPEFLNSNFDVVPNEPFVLKFKGCDSGCKIELLNGESKNLKVVQTLVPETTGDEAEITLSKKFPEDTYAFRIEDSNGEVNYSEQFTFEGTVVETTSAEESTTAAETTSSAEETSTSTDESTTMVTVTTDTETMTTPEPSTTESDAASTTESDSAEQTTDSSNSDSDNTDAAVRLGSSHVTLAAAVVAVVGYFL